MREVAGLVPATMDNRGSNAGLKEEEKKSNPPDSALRVFWFNGSRLTRATCSQPVKCIRVAIGRISMSRRITGLCQS